MRTSRPIVGTVLLMCIMLLGPGPSAFAASGTHDTDDTSRLKPRFRTTHVSLSNFWVPLQSLCKGGDYATLVPP